MEEDLQFNRFVKTALESREPFRFVPCASVHRRVFLRWSIPALLAATFAVIAVFHAAVSAPVDRVANVIRLLSEIDGVDLAESDVSSADLLLAWQDAPCRDLL